MIAEFIALAASLIAVIVSIFDLPGVDAPESGHHVSGIVLLVIIVMYISAYVMGIFALPAQARMNLPLKFHCTR